MKQLKYYGALHLRFMECYNIYKYYAALPPKTDFINGVRTNTYRTNLSNQCYLCSIAFQKNLSFNSGVGSIQASLLPNHLYLFAAI